MAQRKILDITFRRYGTQMKMIKQIFKVSGKIILTVIILVLIYGLAAFCLSRIPVNKNIQQSGDVEVYMMTNGVHTDIVVPVKNNEFDWSNTVKFENTLGKDSTAKFVAFGWGDKNFYLDTPTWSDLKFSTAFKATLGLSEAALHVTFYQRMFENKSCRKLKISQENYMKLVDYIYNSFEKTENDRLIHIDTDAVYGKNDAFYEAKGSYHLFYTCNTWANDALKACHQKACFWTPFDKGIFYHYR